MKTENKQRHLVERTVARVGGIAVALASLVILAWKAGTVLATHPNSWPDPGTANIVEVQVVAGDDSGSKSEEYDVVVYPKGSRRRWGVGLSSVSGQRTSGTIKLVKGYAYDMRLRHKKGLGDYDYTWTVEGVGLRQTGELGDLTGRETWFATNGIVINDEKTLLGVYGNGTGDPDNTVPFYARNRKITVYVPKVDIDTDTDNDGTIDSDDSGEDEFEEYAPGRILCVDGKGVDDNTDYLAEIKLAIQPTLPMGTAKLEALAGGSRIQLWTTADKTTEVPLPKTYDLTTVTLPDSLYIDGIDTGAVELALSYTPVTGQSACTDRVDMLIVPTMSYAPGSSNAYVWFSLPSLGTDDGTEFENQLQNEGFRVTWFIDSTSSDTNFEQCTLANYKDMPNAGAFTVISHGAAGKHFAVYAEATTSGSNACVNWCDSESSTAVRFWPGDCYCVEVSSKWLDDNWKAGMDANQAIAMWSICYSASDNPGEGEESVKEAAGGRWRSGYELPTHVTEARDVNERFLSRLNGASNGGCLRTAGEAWEEDSLNTWRTFGGWSFDDDGDYIDDRWVGSVKMDGNDWTTFCPAPLANKAVFPDTTAGNRNGWGCIIFDTYMCSTNEATDALEKTTGCPTSDHRWFGNANGDYGLGFDFDKTGGAATTMRAVADKCRNEGEVGGLPMDGDRVTPGGDDREWSF